MAFQDSLCQLRMSFYIIYYILYTMLSYFFRNISLKVKYFVEHGEAGKSLRVVARNAFGLLCRLQFVYNIIHNVWIQM